MTQNNLYNPIFLFTLLIFIITINTISSIHFMMILLAGILFMGFSVCLKNKYLYSLFFIILTFIFIEINAGLKPLSLTLLSLFLYIFVIPLINRVVSLHKFDDYIFILLFYVGIIIIWSISMDMTFDIFTTILINLIIDLLFFGVFF
ncbi:hypothetical protein [Poseidonibacter sp.]|uniref:hypothetical protein n=1 Tax=Poseidonibacter sp. TaxID=2321188 RepID=UPI00359E542D